MSIKLQFIDALQPIEALLGAMDGQLEDTDVVSLKRSHKSVGLSFLQMIVHIQNLITREPPGDMQTLLQTFRDMAVDFFKNYELSLLTEIRKQQSIQTQVQKELAQIGANADLEEVRVLLIKNEEAASVESKRLINTFPTLLQYAVDKLKDEWQRLNTLAVANRGLTENTKLFTALEVVVDVAAYSVGIAAERIAIVPGSSFALYFFSYLKNFAVLSVPIYSVKAPWEWSIFWHELAGYQVRKLKTPETIDAIRERLLKLQTHYRQINTPEEQETLLREITRDKNKFNFGYLKLVFGKPEEELDLSSLGSFDYQFGQLMANLPKDDSFKTYELMRDQGWSVDWFEELFEDAWSVLAIGKDFIDFFEDVLGRHTSVDDRHPPGAIRLEVGNQILTLMSLDFEAVEPPTSVVESAAQQILKFVSLLQAASYRYESKDMQQISTRIRRTDLPEKIGNEIGKSIQFWLKQVDAEGGSIFDAKVDAEQVITDLSNEELSRIVHELGKHPESVAIQLEPTYTELLDKKSFLQLLDLSFYDTDFGVARVTNVFYKSQLVHAEANLTSPTPEVDGGFVRYETSPGTKKHTTFDFWNAAAAPGSTINL